MRVLILSCHTGEGHNSAGQAVCEYLQKNNETVEMLDYMCLASNRIAKIVAKVYINIARYTPKFFGVLYQAGLAISNTRFKSPVYWCNTLMAKPLYEYLQTHSFDVIVMPHLYPAETLTYMKKKYKIPQKTVVITTDYTCIPFWEETECDAYILPCEELMDEYIKRGIPKEKLFPLGIPVKQAFSEKQNCEAIKRKLKLTQERVYLIMSGSMGFGNVRNFTEELSRQCSENERLIVVCGNNHHLYRVLKKEYGNHKRVTVIGYTKHVAELMQIADVVFTKPGGLSSTEVINKNRPLIHTMPIPGCESRNRDLFLKLGLSKSADDYMKQIDLGRQMSEEEKERMLQAQKAFAKPDAAKNIVQLLHILSGEE